MIRIRECRRDDFEEVVGLLRQLWPGKELDASSLRPIFDRALASAVQNYVCATDEEKVIGFGSLTLKSNLWQAGLLGHIDELVVDATHRGQGVGTKLLRHLVRLAGRQGCRRVELDSAFHRKEAHRFYQKQGFENRAYLFSKALEAEVAGSPQVLDFGWLI